MSHLPRNVFGNPVTDETARLLFPNLNTITARERAQTALQYMNADRKAADVSKFVHDIQKGHPETDGTKTLGMIYNATGDNLTFVQNYNWDGWPYNSADPQLIQNGQWFGFMHVSSIVKGPSKGAYVLRGTNNDNIPLDWVLAWHSTTAYSANSVYTGMMDRTPGLSDSNKPVNWGLIGLSFNTQKHSTTSLGCYSTVSIGTGSTPELVGVMTLDGLDANYMAMANDFTTIQAMLDGKEGDAADEDAE